MLSIRSLPILFLCLALPLAANSSVEVAGYPFPKQFESLNQLWELQGTHHFRYKRIFSVFAAALYYTNNPEGKRLRFTYTRNLKADDLREQAMNTLEAHNSTETLATYQDSSQELQKAYIDVKAGDSYTLTVITDKGIWLHLNDKELFHSEDSEFGYWYLDIWLGDPPISDSLKSDLIKGQTQ